MEKKISIKKNLLYSTCYQLLNVLIPFITAPYISRIIGAEGIGIQSFTLSNQFYFLLFASLGTTTYGVKEISTKRDNVYERSKAFWEIELMTVCTSLVVMCAWIVFAIINVTYRVYYLVLTIGFLTVLFDISWFFNGIEQFRLTVIRNIIFKIVGTVCLFLFIHGKEDLLLYILITAVTGFFSSLSLWPFLKKSIVKINIKELRFKNHFKKSFVYFLPSLAISAYTVFDKTLIGVITKDANENGYYQQAQKILDIAKSIVFLSINSVMSPRMAYYAAEKNYFEMQRKIENTMNYIMFMGFGCCFGISGVAKTFVPLFFGEGYDSVIPLLYIFCPILIIIGVSNCLDSHYYTPFDQRKKANAFVIIGAIINIGLNTILITKFRACGAAIASVIAEIIITCLYLKNAGEYGRFSLVVRCGRKKLIAGTIMFFAVFFLNDLALGPIIRLLLQVFVGGILYFALLYVLKDNWVINTLKNTIKKIKKWHIAKI